MRTTAPLRLFSLLVALLLASCEKPPADAYVHGAQRSGAKPVVDRLQDANPIPSWSTSRIP